MTANRFRGEATLLAAGTPYTLVADVNAFVLAEEATGLDLQPMLEALDRRRSSVSLTRSLLWALLQARHAGTNQLRAGEIMGEAGPVNARAAVMQAIAAAFPRPAETKEPAGEGEENPPIADGIGNASSPAGAG